MEVSRITYPGYSENLFANVSGCLTDARPLEIDGKYKNMLVMSGTCVSISLYVL